MKHKVAPVTFLRLAFKPGTDYVRGARAIKIAETLLEEGARVMAHDPAATESFKKLFPQIEYTKTEETLKCDAILIVTEWEELEHLDYTGKIVIEGRRVNKARETRIYEGACW